MVLPTFLWFSLDQIMGQDYQGHRGGIFQYGGCPMIREWRCYWWVRTGRWRELAQGMSHMWGWGRWTLPGDDDLLLDSQHGKPGSTGQNVLVFTLELWPTNLQITLRFGIFMVPRNVSRTLSQRSRMCGEFTLNDTPRNATKIELMELRSMYWLFYYVGGWPTNMVWFHLEQNWKVREIWLGHSYLSPSQLCYFSSFFRLFFSFLSLGVSIFQTSVIFLYTISRFLPDYYNQYWFI